MEGEAVVSLPGLVWYDGGDTLKAQLQGGSLTEDVSIARLGSL